eukprot:386445_1
MAFDPNWSFTYGNQLNHVDNIMDEDEDDDLISNLSVIDNNDNHTIERPSSRASRGSVAIVSNITQNTEPEPIVQNTEPTAEPEPTLHPLRVHVTTALTEPSPVTSPTENYMAQGNDPWISQAIQAIQDMDSSGFGAFSGNGGLNIAQNQALIQVINTPPRAKTVKPKVKIGHAVCVMVGCYRKITVTDHEFFSKARCEHHRIKFHPNCDHIEIKYQSKKFVLRSPEFVNDKLETVLRKQRNMK